MAVFTLNPKGLNSNQMIFCQLPFMLPAMVFISQIILVIGNNYSIAILKFYYGLWFSCLIFSVYISYKILKSNHIANIKIISVFLALISLYVILANLKILVYLLRELFEFLADFFWLY